MTDQVTITWVDATGTYTSSFTIENPTLDQVKNSKSNMPMMIPDPKAEVTDAEFYAGLSSQMVNQVLSQTQQNMMHQAMSQVPPVSVTPVDPPP